MTTTTTTTTMMTMMMMMMMMMMWELHNPYSSSDITAVKSRVVTWA